MVVGRCYPILEGRMTTEIPSLRLYSDLVIKTAIILSQTLRQLLERLGKLRVF